MFRKLLTATAIVLAIAHTSAQAATVNLLVAGDNGSLNPGVDFFQQIDPQSTGTGVIDPFLRIQAKGNNTTEQGYNTDARPLQFDEDNAWTSSLLLDDVPIVNIGGTDYRQFLLDINQVNSDPLLSLYELQILLGNSPNLTGGTVDGDGTLSLSGATQIYDMGAGNTVELNYALNPGSGAGDMFAYIADSLFNPALGPYVYLFSAFGLPEGANDGFEEWAVLKGGTAEVPEPSVVVMAIVGLLPVGFVNLRRHLRRRKEATA